MGLELIMGTCISKQVKPEVCDLLVVSTVSGSVKLTSKKY